MGKLRGKKRTRFAVSIGVALVGLGLILGVSAAVQHLRSSASRHWPTVEGIISVSEIKSYEDSWQYTDEGSGETKTHTDVTYKPLVKYSYTVYGMQYENDRRSFFEGEISDLELSQAVTGKYPAGIEVLVHYNPDDFEDAVLEPGSDSVLVIPLVLGLLLCALGAAPLGMIFVEHRNKKKNK